MYGESYVIVRVMSVLRDCTCYVFFVVSVCVVVGVVAYIVTYVDPTCASRIMYGMSVSSATYRRAARASPFAPEYFALKLFALEYFALKLFTLRSPNFSLDFYLGIE